MERVDLADGIRISDERCVLTVRRPVAHVALVKCEGYARGEHVPYVVSFRDRILRDVGRIALFDDVEGLQGYEADVRARLTAWARAHDRVISTFHILVRSKLVAMGVSLASAATGGKIQAHTDRRTFEQALAREVHVAREARRSARGAGPL